MAERIARVAEPDAVPTAAAGSTKVPTASGPPVVVKKYANRRLYNTESSSYVTLEDLAGMVRLGRDFVVYDAKSGDDITRSVLTQIIVEEESKGRSMLPESFLRHLISFYGDSLQSILPRYLDVAMQSFSRQQEQMRASMQHAMGGFMPFPGAFGLEEMGKQNVAMMERAMNLFAPFRPAEAGMRDPVPREGAQKDSGPRDTLQAMEAMTRELESLREQLAALPSSRAE